MLDLINRYSHGYVAIPVMYTCHRLGLLKALSGQPSNKTEGQSSNVSNNLLMEMGASVSVQDLVEQADGNAGHLLVAFRLLHSLNIIDPIVHAKTEIVQGQMFTPKQRWQVGANFHYFEQLPANIDELLAFPIKDALQNEADANRLNAWIELALEGWHGADPLMVDLLDAWLVVPLLMTLMEAGLSLSELADHLEKIIEPVAAIGIRHFFVAKGWAEFFLSSNQNQSFQDGVQDPQWRLTPAGQTLCERAMIFGSTTSYRPMLLNLAELLTGQTQNVFRRDQLGFECHVDRNLNVISSGFQHERYFSDAEVVVMSVFDTEDFQNQPNYIADMGCGDGTFLAQVYDLIKTQTARGRVLDQFPLTLLAVDYNEASLMESAQTLAGRPHQTIHGDIGDPASLVDAFIQLGIDPDSVMHIRSFLDHDRPFIEPQFQSLIPRISSKDSSGIYVGRDGEQIAADCMVQSLIEHFSRWANVVGRYGLMVLEVHNQRPKVVQQFLDQTESLHFDAYHGFSSQYLVEADIFLLSAASAGLFPKTSFSHRYPKSFAFSRITLNWFERRPYQLRQATMVDLPALVNLDHRCWEPHLRQGQKVLADRLEMFPQGQFVLESDGNIIAALYSQRIASIDCLNDQVLETVLSLHQSEGPVVQLLGLNVDPTWQEQGIGDQLLEFMLKVYQLHGCITDVVGVTRCKQYGSYFREQSDSLSFADYVASCASSASDSLSDPTLHFHQYHGAEILQVLKGYWSADRDNQGFGVLIHYDLHHGAISISQSSSVLSSSNHVSAEDVPFVVEESVKQILGSARVQVYDPAMALMAMGLDSLDLLELRALLAYRTGQPLEPMFFFSYGSPQAVIQKLTQMVVPLASAEANPKSAFMPVAQEEQVSHEASDGSNEPIAIIGMACRFPGGVTTPDEFWQLLRSGQDGISSVPTDRWSDAFSKGYLNRGGFIEGVDQFDAGLFHIAPREANYIDPQHRLLLEVSWEALENSGIDPQSLQQTQTGVFTGIFSHDYESYVVAAHPDREFDTYLPVGNSAAMAAGRIAYSLGLEGPAVSINTACSSSLVALHMAVKSLQQGESNLALVSGVNLMLTPDLTVAFGSAGMLASDGLCKTFDASADGYVRSEGCAVVVLKRLVDAQRHNDNILAIVKGSAINQDGASNGLTAPNGLAQEKVIQQALRSAQLQPAEVDAVEAHGTGTSLGDPIEVAAIAKVYGASRTPLQSLWLSSVKTNIGHTEAVAGLAGLIKQVLALQYQQLPAHLHFNVANPEIHLSAIPAKIPVRTQPWPLPDREGPRRVGVSSFGFSGTNAHVILEEYQGRVDQAGHDEVPQLVTISARTMESLKRRCEQLLQWLQTNSNVEFARVAQTLNRGRAQMKHRLAWRLSSTAQLIEQLQRVSFADPKSGAQANTFSIADHHDAIKTAFLFTGQGAQTSAMGRYWYQHFADFRKVFDCVAECLRDAFPQSLHELLWGEQSDTTIHQTAYTQPLLFALEISLARLWQSWGVQPHSVLGHSVGEYAAAVVAGVMSLEDAAQLIMWRGKLMQALPAGGGMLALRCREPITETDSLEKRILPYIESTLDQIAVAAINGPQSIVLSGDLAALEDLKNRLGESDIICTPLTVSHGFHSPLMAPMLEAFAAKVEQIELHLPDRPFYSTLTGKVAAHELTQPTYWMRHVSQPVLFYQGMQSLVSSGANCFIEMGPQPVLLGMARAFIDNHSETRAYHFLPAMKPLVCEAAALDVARINTSIFEVQYLAGMNLNWEAIYRDAPLTPVVLPTYPFEHQRYWVATNDLVHGRQSPEQTPLCGQRLNSPLATQQFQTTWSSEYPRYLADHGVVGLGISPQPLVASASYMALVASAMQQQIGPSKAFRLTEVFLHEPLLLGDQAVDVQTVMESQGANTVVAQVFSCPAGNTDSWTKHFSCHADLLDVNAVSFQQDLNQAKALHSAIKADSIIFPVTEFYQQCLDGGIYYGKAFQRIQEIRQMPNGIMSKVDISSLSEGGFFPPLVDGILQTSLPFVFQQLVDRDCDQITYLPVAIDELLCLKPLPSRIWSYACLSAHNGMEVKSEMNGNTLKVDIYGLDENQQLCFIVKSLTFREANFEQLLLTSTQQSATKRFPTQQCLHGLAWVEERGVWHGDATLPAVTDYQRIPDYLTVERYDYSLLRQAFDQLCGGLILNSFITLGWCYKEGDRFSLDELVAQFHAKEEHRPLLVRLVEVLCEQNYVSQIESLNQSHQSVSCWQVETKLGHYQTTSCQDQFAQLKSDYPNASHEIDLFQRCSESLAEVLVGNCDPLELIFPSTDRQSTTAFYQQSPTFVQHNALIEQVMTRITQCLTDGITLRILEVGGGTGATTAGLLPLLETFSIEYVFTDISPLFVQDAKEKFSSYPFVQCRTLDIEQNPLSQGFLAAEFDIVIAANVVHATQDLAQSLSSIGCLLRPRGQFILLEGIAKTPWIDMIFGLTRGWWSCVGDPVRDGYPLMDMVQWEYLLLSEGYDRLVCLQPEIGGELFEQAVIVAERSSSKDLQILESNNKEEGPSCYLLSEDSEFVASISQSADSQGYRIIPLHFDVSIEEQLPLELNANDQFIYFYQPTIKDGGEAKAVSKVQQAIIHRLREFLQGILSQYNASDERLSVTIVTEQSQAVLASDAVDGVMSASQWGLIQALELEYPQLAIRRLDIDRHAIQGASDRMWSAIINTPAHESQLGLRQGDLYWPRLVSIGERTEYKQLCKSQSQQLDQLHYIDAKRRAPSAGEIEIAVTYSGLNFIDVLDGLGQLPNVRDHMGIECVGRVVSVGKDVGHLSIGDWVMALAPGALAEYVTVNALLAVQCPKGMPLPQAATLPVAYVTAYNALVNLGDLQSTQRVLIHCATGASGLAALLIARHMGAEVFVTASLGKHHLLTALGVEESHILDSRTCDFAERIQELTHGQGVNFVLNSLTGEAIPAGLGCLADNGLFVEIGKTDHWSTGEVAQAFPHVRYQRLDMLNHCYQNPDLIQQSLMLIKNGVEQGFYPALPFHRFNQCDTGLAFRRMQQARHVGKLIIEQQPEAVVAIHPINENQSSSLQLDADAIYVVTGGFKGIGLQTARWLLERGAKSVAILGRSELSDANQRLINQWQGETAKIYSYQVDVTDSDRLEHCLNEVRQIAPIKGIFHSVGVLDDGAFMQQTDERFNQVMAPKVYGAWALHCLTQTDELDYFVLYSSVASLFGSAGQTNHAAANSFLDSLAAYRCGKGLSGLSINWCGWDEIGSAASRGSSASIRSGMASIKPEQGFAVLEHVLTAQNGNHQVGVAPMDWRVFFDREAEEIAAKGIYQFNHPVSDCGEANQSSGQKHQQNNNDVTSLPFTNTLTALPITERGKALREHIEQLVCLVLSFPASTWLDGGQGFFQMGMDSLMSVEFRTRLQSSLECRLSSSITFDYPTIDSLFNYLVSPGVLNVEFDDQAKETRAHSESTEDLSLDEAADLLSQLLSE